jgi:hypothetical protein
MDDQMDANFATSVGKRWTGTERVVGMGVLGISLLGNTHSFDANTCLAFLFQTEKGQLSPT